MPQSIYSVKISFLGDVIFPKFTPEAVSIAFKYPESCSNYSCSPYELTLEPGVYQFECWGAKGPHHTGSPGFGAYTKGVIRLRETKKFYIFIGATGYFNAIKERSSSSAAPQGSGGSTDVRLETSDNWYDQQSLASRIMVAAGGGSAEWKNSIGGNGGTIEGVPSYSATYIYENSSIFDTPCPGATQTESQQCDPLTVDSVTYTPVSGGFDYAGNPKSDDEGGFGGNGYYGGTSYPFAFAGSGGSSFISGHKGCIAIHDPSTKNGDIVHKEDSIHYSGISFENTEMISGNTTMPLPDSNTRGKWSEENGAFRLTYLLIRPHTCKSQKQHFAYSSLIFSLNVIKQ